LPANRYLLITLSGDADIKDHQTRTVHGWRCRYDLQTGKFDVPPVLLQHNAKAIVPGAGTSTHEADSQRVFKLATCTGRRADAFGRV